MRFLWLALLVTNAASAAELRSIEVEHEHGTYSLVSEVWFDASADAVFQVFSTWSTSTQFSSAIVEARDLEPDESGRPGFYTLNRGCILFFCKTVVREGWVEKEGRHLMRAFADPERSDFIFSNETWTFDEDSGGTRVVYQLRFDPKFWIPPGIGPYLIKRKLRNEGGHAIGRIEAVARRLGSAGE